MIALVRIDDRLVHGQVVEGWMPFLGATGLLVVSDQAAADPVQKALMALSLPEGVEFVLTDTAGAAAACRAAEGAARPYLVLVPGPVEALAMVDSGIPVKVINVGGLHFAAGCVQLGKALFLSREDLRAMGDLAARGVRLEGRSVPTDRSVDVAVLVSECYSEPGEVRS